MASWLSIATPAPSLLSPYSLAVVIPYLILAEPFPAFSVVPALFLPAGLVIVLGRAHRPTAGAIAFGILAPLSLFFSVWGIRPGIAHYGATHTLGILAINMLLCLLLAFILRRARRRPTFGRLLLFHGGLWCWVAWIGFPWLRQLF